MSRERGHPPCDLCEDEVAVLVLLEGDRATGAVLCATCSGSSGRIASLEAEIAALPEERDDGRAALDFLSRQGYRRCDIPACNCGSWHGGRLWDRLREIEAVVEPANGQTLLAAVVALREREERYREALTRMVRACTTMMGPGVGVRVPDRDSVDAARRALEER